MRILVLGAAGFTGSALLQHILQIEGVAVTAMIHSKAPVVVADNVSYVTSSLQDIDYGFLQKGDFDYIFHLARISGKRFGNIGRWWAGKQGAKANTRLLKNIARLQKKPKLIYLSGSLMYGNRPGENVTENEPLKPTGFARFYYLAEKPLLNAIETDNENIMMLRAPWIIGNGSWFAQLYSSHIHKQHTVPVYGNTERKMSIITVEDCAGMLWHYANHAAYGKVYNIYTRQCVGYNDFINKIAASYNCSNYKTYTEEDMVQITDTTTCNSVCCEVVLSTVYQEMLDSYQPLFTNLETYIAQLATVNDRA